MYKQLKSILLEDLAAGLNIDCRRAIELSDKQANHVYKTEGKYKADYQGYLIFSFNNETAWYWNKDIEVEINLDSERQVEFVSNSEDVVVERLEGSLNKFLVKKLKYNADFTISVNNNEIVEWSFNVKDGNSIDFKMYFIYNYLSILDSFIDKMNLMNDCNISKDFHITDMEKKLNNKEINIKDNEHIVKELNTIIQDKDKAILNKDALINKKNSKIKTLEYRITELNSKVQRIEKTVNNNNLEPFSNIPQTKPNYSFTCNSNTSTTSKSLYNNYNNTNTDTNPWSSYYNTNTEPSDANYYINKGKFW